MNGRILAAAALLVSAPAWAINKCPGPDGKPVYQDAPCVGGEKVNTSGAGVGDPSSSGGSYYLREAARLEREDQRETAQQARAEKVRNAIYQKKVFVGMTADEAKQSWGTPSRINATVSGAGRTEQWVYDRGRAKSQYVYVDNGVVRSIQE